MPDSPRVGWPELTTHTLPIHPAVTWLASRAPDPEQDMPLASALHCPPTDCQRGQDKLSHWILLSGGRGPVRPCWWTK